jgi:transcription elongation factor GreA
VPSRYPGAAVATFSRVTDNPMTAEELETLRAELEQLEGPARAEMAEQIKTARGWGDLKENAEYHAAKEAQAHLETKILKLRDRVLTATVVEAAEGDTVDYGSTVEVEDETTGASHTYKLVSSREAAPGEGRLSIDSPVAAALRGRRQGEVAVVQTPRGERRFVVKSVS